MALHTDAGIKTDKIIGPMAICMTKSDNKDNYTSGVSRLISRDFADLMLTQITTDLQKIYGEKWQHRGIVDQSYVEAREPEIPYFINFYFLSENTCVFKESSILLHLIQQT